MSQQDSITSSLHISPGSKSLGASNYDPPLLSESPANAFAMIAAAAVHAQPLPTLSVQPPDDLPSAMAHPEPVVTPNGDVGSTPLPSTPGTPPAIISTATTPIVPLSAANAQRNPFPGSPAVGASAAGSKRTASGTVKLVPTNGASVPSSPQTPATPGRFARSQSNMDTSPRNVSQLSSQLKTRLTYALLKVQNNWTSESLEQVEARVSQGQHPTSPRIRIKRERESSIESGYEHMLRHHRTNSEPSSAHPLPPNHQVGGAGGRTYESFWREHEHNPITKKILQAKAASQALGTTTSKSVPPILAHGSPGSALQPPAQIIPDRDRRSQYNPMRQPPGLYQSLSTQSNASTISLMPNTPPALSGPDAQRTMEQDAVESLMFLSSPGHSQRRLSQSQSQSQLRELVEVAVEEELPSSQSTQPERYNYGRNATTWPRSRRVFKQARTGLGSLRMTDSGVGFDDDLTDEEGGAGGENYPRTLAKGKQKEDATRVIPNEIPGDSVVTTTMAS